MFICWGELLWDIFASGPELGGAAANVAINLLRLGVSPVLVSRVGSDTLGDRAVSRLSDLGLDTAYIQRDSSAPTGTVTIRLRDGEPHFAISTQAAWERLDVALCELPSPTDTQAIIYSAMAQRTALVSKSLRNVLQSRARHCWSVCDLNLRPPYLEVAGIRETLAHADAVKMNETEAARLNDILGGPDPIDTIFSNFAVRIIAVTRQERGCSVFSRSERVDHQGFPKLGDNGDSVGAGDAFCAALAYHLVHGASLSSIARDANDHARRVASAHGAFGFVTT